MATENSWSKSTNISSDETFEFTCNVCAKRNENIEAFKYCVECQDNLCLGCTEWHNRFRLLSSHVLKNVELASQDSTCPKHPKEIIKMYCFVHDVVACSTCTTKYHKSCNDIKTISDIAKTIDIKQVTTAFKRASARMLTLKKTWNKVLHDLSAANQRTLEAIQTCRKELNQTLDELEIDTKQQLEERSKSFQMEWQAIIEQITAIGHNLKERLHKIQNTGNILQQFILTNTSKETLSMADSLSNQLLPCTVQMNFSQDQIIKVCREQVLELGNTSHSIWKGKLGRYKVRETAKCNVKIISDTKTCSVNGSCFVDSGVILLADHANSKLKLFDPSTNSVTSYCILPAKPCAVCTVTHAEAAVSLNNNTVQFVSIADPLLLTRTLHIGHVCDGLAICGGKLYITCGSPKLFVYALTGTPLTCINMNKHNVSNIQSVMAFNDKIYATVNIKGLITIDTENQTESTYTEYDLGGARNICTDAFGNVFVCGWYSHNVLQLGQDGQNLGEVLRESDGLCNPRSMCFDKKHCRLVLTNSDNDSLLVFTLE